MARPRGSRSRRIGVGTSSAPRYRSRRTRPTSSRTVLARRKGHGRSLAFSRMRTPRSPRGVAFTGALRLAVRDSRGRGNYLVDPASSHMLVSKIKPCMSKYRLLHSETANGSLNQLWFLRSFNPTWITVAILELIHEEQLRPFRGRALLLDQDQYGLCPFLW